MKPIDLILTMAHSKVKNYGIPGVTSSLISDPSENGLVRLFSVHRDHQEAITPHSHKFDFASQFISGKVINRIWTESSFGDDFAVSKLTFKGDMGKYEKEFSRVAKYSFKDTVYNPGDWYAMDHNQIHSIYFSKGSQILFFEGPKITDETVIIDPYVDGEHIESFEVKSWMFKKV